MINFRSMNNFKRLNKQDKIFIAGSSGMVGSAITKVLRKSNYGMKKFNGKIFCPTREELNLLNFQDVQDWFYKFKPDIVIIAAAKVGGIYANKTKPYDFILENLKIQNNLIEVAWKVGVKRLLFLGSSCIYPKFAKQPISEEYLLSGALEKTNEFYAIAKIAGIKLCESLRKQYNFDAISLMPTNLYGPGDNYHPKNSHVIPSLIRRFYEAKSKNLKEVNCWGTGDALREFLYVDDLAEACLFTLENWDPSNSYAPKTKNGDSLAILNVGSEEEISIKDLAIKISQVVGFTGNILWDADKPNGTPRKKLDNRRINSLGWNPKINLDIGLRKTLIDFEKSFNNKNLRE